MTTPRRPARRRRARSTGAVFLVFVAVLATLLVGCGGNGDGAALPDVALSRLDGSGSVALAEADGTLRVLNLWATWCVPCRRELPAFDEVAAAAGDELEVVGINIGQDPATAAGLVDELGLDFPQLLDGDSEVTAALEVTSMPSTAFVDGEGRVVDVHAGAMDADQLRTTIEDVLGVDIPVSR